MKWEWLSFDHENWKVVGPDGKPWLGWFATWRKACQLRRLSKNGRFEERVNIKRSYNLVDAHSALIKVVEEIGPTFSGLYVEDLKVMPVQSIRDNGSSYWTLYATFNVRWDWGLYVSYCKHWPPHW